MAIVTALVLSCIAYCASAADLFEGDIILDPKTDAIVNGVKTFDAIVSETRKWPGAVVPYSVDSNFDSARRQVVREAIKEFHKYTCIRFTPRTNQQSYVKFVIRGGCYSYIGMIGGEQPISIGRGCQYKGIVMHEMMHASGFWHEQSRLDRDRYIRINWQNVHNGRNNFNFQKYRHGEADYYGEGYDFDSLMHYGNWDFSVNKQMTIEAISDPKKILGQRDGFSQTDVNQLNKVYKCEGYENVKVPPLKGCIDRHSSCSAWARAGDCGRNQQHMLTNCCKSCKNGGSEDCIDKNKSCSGWALAGECARSKQYMSNNCCKSCKNHKSGGGRSRCVDLDKDCKSWADGGHCRSNPGYMLKYCKKSCRVC